MPDPYENKPAMVVTGTAGVPLATEASLAALLIASGGTAGPGPAATGNHVSQSSVRDDGNTNLSTLAAGQTWTGTWVDMTGYSQAVTSFKSDQAGVFYLQFSSDGITADSTLGPFSLAANTNSPQTVLPSRKYFRVTQSNLSGATANLRTETRLYAIPGELTSRIQDTISKFGVAKTVRAVLSGVEENGNTYTNVKVRQEGALAVHLDDPLTGFGEVQTAVLEPLIQIDAVYGLLDTDHEALIDASPGTGSAAATDGQFVCQTGTGVGGYGVVQSRRLCRYRPGQAVRARFTAMFSVGVASSLQYAGLLSATDALAFGYRGATFGVLRRIPGKATIAQLTITGTAAGAETITVKLNNVDFTVTSGGALGTTALVAERIAETIVATGWTSVVSPTSNGSTVTFIQSTPGVAAGTYSLTSTGTVTGSFVIVQAGVANDDDTGFVPQASWNRDVMDGSGSASNPSGLLLDSTKINVFEIEFIYLGGGPIIFYVRLPGGGHQEVHVIEFPNASISPSIRNPTMRIAWFTASLGSTTNLTLKGASGAAFVAGQLQPMRDPFGFAITNFTADTTEHVAFAIRVGSVFGSIPNAREVVPIDFRFCIETSNRVVRVRLVLNPTMSGTVNWAYVNSSRSVVEYATPTSLTPSGGSDVGYLVCASGSPAALNLTDVGLRLVPGDVLAVCVVTASGTAVCSGSKNWWET